MTPPPKYDVFRVVVLGEAGVGKTSLIERAVHVREAQSASGKQKHQAQPFLSKKMRLGSARVQLDIWESRRWDADDDGEGAAVASSLRRAGEGGGPDAAVLVYDVTDRASFDAAKAIERALQDSPSEADYEDSEGVVVVGGRVAAGKEEEAEEGGRAAVLAVFAANKQDLAEAKRPPAPDRAQHVSEEEGRAHAASVSARWQRTSAETGKGVEQAFVTIARELLARKNAAIVVDVAGGTAREEDAAAGRSERLLSFSLASSLLIDPLRRRAQPIFAAAYAALLEGWAWVRGKAESLYNSFFTDGSG